MAVKFFNIRSGETLVAVTEPQITALWASSDHSPNITQGQDFGWRLAPEVVVQMKKMRQDRGVMEDIARRFQKPIDEVGESDVLSYISLQTAEAEAPLADVSDYQDEYDASIKALERTGETPVGFDAEETVVTTTTMSTEDLKAELAKREAAEKPTTTTTVKPDEPEITTTTTKSK
jgi:hypothetical protein